MTHWRKPHELVDRLVAFVAVAVAVGIGLVWLPSAHRDWTEILVGAAIGVVLVALAFARRWIPGTTLVVPIGYLVFCAVLRDGTGGARSGFAGLFLLSVLWLALAGSRTEVFIGVVALTLAQVVPLIWIAGADYPSSGWRGTIVQIVVATIAGFTVQTLVAEARARAAESAQQATALAETSQTLSAQNERLVELDQMKDDFIALVSHELRTPLTSIIGYLEMALEDTGTLTETQSQFLVTVQRNVERLADLVNDLLFLARVDSGRLEIDRRELDISPVINQAVESARPFAEAKQVEIVVDVDEPLVAYADRARLAQLVDNLLTNALKFTPSGGMVTLGGRVRSGGVELAIGDTGIGIAEDEIPLLFTRFFRTTTAKSKQIPGTGLGLVISQSIAEAHGSSIAVESVLGEGTTFRLLLPSAPVPPVSA